MVRFVVTPADKRALEDLGGPAALSDLLSEAVEKEGLAAVVRRVTGASA